MRNAPSHHQISGQIGVHPRQLQYSVAYPQSGPAVLEVQDAVQMATQRAREVLNDQVETARRALHHQQGQLLATTRQYEAAAKQNIGQTRVSALARNHEAHNYNVQMQVRQLEHEPDARFLRHRELSSKFSQEENQALENQLQILVTDATSEVRSQDEQLYDLLTEPSFQAPHPKVVTQQQNQEYAGRHQHLTRLVQEIQHNREMFEESRAAQSAAGRREETQTSSPTEL